MATKLFLLLSLFFLCSCSPKTSTPQSTSLDPYTVLSEATLSHSDNQASGQGKLLFTESLEPQAYGMRVAFSLLNNGSLTVFARTDSVAIDGVKIVFTRQNLNLKVVVHVADESIELSSLPGFNSQNASNDMAFTIELGACTNNLRHLFIWDGNSTIPSADLALYNSSEIYSGVSSFPTGCVTGDHWAIELNNSTLTQAHLDDAYF